MTCGSSLRYMLPRNVRLICFNVGFSAKAIRIGEAGPSGEWHRDQADEVWSEYTAKVCFSCLNLRYSLDPC